MGKLQNIGKSHVKRETVSASTNLEVISHESFIQRLEGMSSACQNCQRERLRSQRGNPSRRGKSNRRKQHSKSTAPIIIHLKDTLRSVGKRRQSSLDGDSDVSTRSTDEELYASSSSGGSSNSGSIGSHGGRGFLHHQIAAANRKSNLNYIFSSAYRDVASIPEFVPQYSSHQIHQAWPNTMYYTASQTFPNMFPSSTITHKSQCHFHADLQMVKETSRNNLTGLISVIEKAHKQELKDIEPNLIRNSTDAKLGSILNNASLSSQSDPEFKRKNMAECENVELICNDLSTSASKLTESSDESDTSDKASVVSSSDTLSDDLTDLPVIEEVKGQHEFTAEELEQLAEYTTGVPLFRYDYSSPQCVDCINDYYNYQYFQYENPFSSTWHTSHHSPYPSAKQQHHQPSISTNCFEDLKKAVTSPRTSTSSESDLLSDIDNNSTDSNSSSKTSSSGSLLSFNDTAESVSTDNQNAPTNPNITKKVVREEKLIKRATVSWKHAGRFGNSDRPRAAKRVPRQTSNFTDSVYLDLTGLGVSISVMYHTESPVYPVYPFYQALYSPTTTPLTPGFSFPVRFNNQMLYSFHSEAAPPPEFKKYDMTVPPSRPWITTGAADKNVPAAVFSLMCYNVLCDKLCTKAMYAYCPTWALSWDYRKKGIMNDIERNDADIITLQEVETEQYYSMFLPELALQEYDGIFLPKSRVRTMNSDKEKKSVDGCAIFFKKTKFEKVNEYQIEFSQLATKEGASNTDTDMINRVSTKDNIAIVAVLRTKPGAYDNSPVAAPKGLTQMLMVSTAHIHWDPQFPDVKLVQTMMLIEELRKFVKEATLQFRPNAPPPSLDTDLCNSIPLILCGDFNSLPDSGVYEYLSKGTVDSSHKDFEGQNYQAFMKDRNYNGNITHNFKLTSAYKDVIPFTNYTFDFKGIIDYIFYSDQHLRLHGVMGLQDEEWFRANKIVGCPHPFVPSDHFPLFAEFSLPVSSQRPR